MIHVVGKDILRFHAVYWPALLMAAGLEVTRTKQPRKKSKKSHSEPYLLCVASFQCSHSLLPLPPSLSLSVCSPLLVNCMYAHSLLALPGSPPPSVHLHTCTCICTCCACTCNCVVIIIATTAPAAVVCARVVDQRRRENQQVSGECD